MTTPRDSKVMDATIVLARIPNLPPEIVSTICQNADRAVLKSLRRVSKQMREYVTPDLFRVVHLRVNLQSYAHFEAIHTSPHLRNYVRSLRYDGRLLPWNKEEFEDYEELLKHFRGWILHDPYGKTFESEEIYDAIKKCFTQSEIEGSYRNYFKCINEQKKIHRNAFEVDSLVRACSCLPNLVSLDLDTGRSRSPISLHTPERIFSQHSMRPLIRREHLREALGHLSSIGRSCWIEPGFPNPDYDTDEDHESTNTFGVKRLLALIETSHRVGTAVTSLSVTGLDVQHVLKKIALPPLPMIQDFFGGLKYVSFDARNMWHHNSDESWQRMAILMTLATNLQGLEIRATREDDGDPEEQALEELLRHKFPKLRRLELEGLYLSESDLRVFVANHQLSQVVLNGLGFDEDMKEMIEEAAILSTWEPKSKEVYRRINLVVPNASLEERAVARLSYLRASAQVAYVSLCAGLARTPPDLWQVQQRMEQS